MVLLSIFAFLIGSSLFVGSAVIWYYMAKFGLIAAAILYFPLYKAVTIYDAHREHLTCACGDFKEDHAKNSFGNRTLCCRCDCVKYDPYRTTSG